MVVVWSWAAFQTPCHKWAETHQQALLWNKVKVLEWTREYLNLVLIKILACAIAVIAAKGGTTSY